MAIMVVVSRIRRPEICLVYGGHIFLYHIRLVLRSDKAPAVPSEVIESDGKP